MKIKLHIPTEEYGFVEIESEVNPESKKSIEEVIGDSLHFYNVSKTLKSSPIEGLEPKEWNNALDGYLKLATMPSELYERMSDKQKGLIQEIKKSFKRIAPEKEPRIRE